MKGPAPSAALGTSLAERVAKVMEDATILARQWYFLIEVCLDGDSLMNFNNGTRLPWEIPLPPERNGR